MPVVSNTSPILNLAIIECLDLLRQQFTKVYIPSVVQTELKAKDDLPGSRLMMDALQDGWIEIIPVKNTSLVTALMVDLDAGEAEAIALGLELGNLLVLMDESDGRARARNMGLNLTGTIGILLRAKRLGQVKAVKSLLLELRSKAGFHIAENLLCQVLREAGESS